MLTQEEKDKLFVAGAEDGKSGNDHRTSEPGARLEAIGTGFLLGGPVGAFIGLCVSTKMSEEKQEVYDRGYERGAREHERDLVNSVRTSRA